MTILIHSPKMEAQSSQHSQVIEISGDLPDVRRNPGGSKICGEAPCGFSDAGSIPKDSEERSTSMRKLLMAVVLCVIFMSIEVVGGIKTNSLAILSDAAHLLSDVAAFATSLFSLWAAGWEANPRQSYGFFRIEILGALVSIQLIWLLAGILVYKAIERIVSGTHEVNGCLMFVVAAFGLVVNIIMALLLGHDHGHGHSDHGHSHGFPVSTHHVHNHHNAEHPKDCHHHTHEDHTHYQDYQHHGEKHLEDEHHHVTREDHIHNHAHEEVATPLLGQSKGRHEKKRGWNINVQGAYLHVLGDSIQSVGVMIGGAIIWYKPYWQIVDLICTLIFSVIVLGTTINMLRNILEVLMESTPREIDAAKLERGLLDMEEVVAVHELHIWAITVGKVLLACHVKIRPEVNADMVLDKVIDYIRRVYNISHVTIQIER